METLDFSWRIKEAPSGEGSFVGLASPYGDPPDLQGDVVQKGAFAQAIRQQPQQGYPLLWAHDMKSPIGTAVVEDSNAGLVVNGKLALGVQAAREALALIRAGACRGISIGFNLPRGTDKVAYRDDGTRILKEIHLLELSCVPIPAAPRAQITSVKSLNDVHDVLAAVQDPTIPDVARALRGINEEMKRLLGQTEENTAEQTLAILKSFAQDLKSSSV